MLAACGLFCFAATGRAFGGHQTEDYIRVPLPPHIRVEATELDGPVFADASGQTLYRWPFRDLRVGNTGDPKGQSNCTDVKTTTNAGYMSPYPGGLTLPELDRRPSCAQAWPPALAPANAQPVGKWTVITRKDGRKQWAYDGFALYTSNLDKRPGDVLGGDSYEHKGDDPAVRSPVQPPPDLPPGFNVATTAVGRLLLTEREFSVYASDADGANKSNCTAECAKTWIPMLAPQSVRPHGDWTIFERSPGVRQWAFRSSRCIAMPWIRMPTASKAVMSRVGTMCTRKRHRRVLRGLQCRTQRPGRLSRMRTERLSTHTRVATMR